MTKKMMLFVALLFVATPMLFAQDANVAAQTKAWAAIGGGLATAIAFRALGVAGGHLGAEFE